MWCASAARGVCGGSQVRHALEVMQWICIAGIVGRHAVADSGRVGIDVDIPKKFFFATTKCASRKRHAFG